MVARPARTGKWLKRQRETDEFVDGLLNTAADRCLALKLAAAFLQQQATGIGRALATRTKQDKKSRIRAEARCPVTNLAPKGQSGWALSSPAGSGCDAPRDTTPRSSAPCRNGQRTRPAGGRQGR
jgi:hypothetical protein